MKTKYISAVIAASVVLVGCSSDRDSRASADQIRAANAETAEPMQRPVTTQMEHYQTPEVAAADTPTAVAPPSTVIAPAPPASVAAPAPAPTAIAPAPPATAEVTDPYASTEYVSENKAEFVTATDQRIKDLDKKITQVSEAVENLQADTVATRTIEKLRDQRSQVGQRFNDLKQASQDSWMTLRRGLESKIKDLETSADEAKAQYVVD